MTVVHGRFYLDYLSVVLLGFPGVKRWFNHSQKHCVMSLDLTVISHSSNKLAE